MAEQEDHYKQSTMIVWPDKEKKGSTKQGIVAGGQEGLLTNKKKKKKRTIIDDKSKKICVCAPTRHIGSFRCRLHRVLGDGQKPSSSFYSKNNAFMVSGGDCGSGGGGGGGGCSGKGQKIRLSRFAKSDCFVASQEENHSGSETSISYS